MEIFFRYYTKTFNLKDFLELRLVCKHWSEKISSRLLKEIYGKDFFLFEKSYRTINPLEFSQELKRQKRELVFVLNGNYFGDPSCFKKEIGLIDWQLKSKSMGVFNKKENPKMEIKFSGSLDGCYGVGNNIVNPRLKKSFNLDLGTYSELSMYGKREYYRIVYFDNNLFSKQLNPVPFVPDEGILFYSRFDKEKNVDILKSTIVNFENGFRTPCGKWVINVETILTPSKKLVPYSKFIYHIDGQMVFVGPSSTKDKNEIHFYLPKQNKTLRIKSDKKYNVRLLALYGRIMVSLESETDSITFCYDIFYEDVHEINPKTLEKLRKMGEISS